jgi:hypothetical protein
MRLWSRKKLLRISLEGCANEREKLKVRARNADPVNGRVVMVA